MWLQAGTPVHRRGLGFQKKFDIHDDIVQRGLAFVQENVLRCVFEQCDIATLRQCSEVNRSVPLSHAELPPTPAHPATLTSPYVSSPAG